MYRFEHGRIVAKVSTLRVRRLLWIRKQLFWERENTQPSPCLAALVEHFEWESEPLVTLRLLFMDLEAAGLRPSLPRWQRLVIEASRADSELAARSTNLSPSDPCHDSILSTGPPPENQDGRDARNTFFMSRLWVGGRLRLHTDFALRSFWTNQNARPEEIEALSIQMFVARLAKRQDKLLVRSRPHFAAGAAWNEAISTLDDHLSTNWWTSLRWAQTYASDPRARRRAKERRTMTIDGKDHTSALSVAPAP